MNGLGMKFRLKPNSPDVCGRKWFKGFFLVAGLIGVGVVSFLELRSSSAISTVKWIPKVIGNWADRNGRFCNFPAFGLMGVPFFMLTSGFRRQMGIIAVLSLFIASLEIIQLAIPTRHCDVWDIFWGSMGVIVAWAVCEVIKRGRLTIDSKPEPASSC